jgi:hypothetical protein
MRTFRSREFMRDILASFFDVRVAATRAFCERAANAANYFRPVGIALAPEPAELRWSRTTALP